ncbi:MAG: hypothetical protein E5X53_32685 [Mesorhizobium sp.]|uniref:hypothetical protein n=1 Tax=Mesorhizobium sp. TaxID=1871066 RepID=UPI00122B0CFF|nr:hypothetical protein [Mesorhizobium sp.]TIP69427.1 MAG: hypothetical protein E5X55_32280 [Mesorhizobium sp.]TIQ03495.1 MAG: hypothetical protein E5X57_30730 [Mesorhizobium sp.]TIR47726.1 MAG: hypothetical protein E5X53_32685 [Mesorhizobium sp.]
MKRVEKALRLSAGLMSVASRRLNVSRTTLHAFVNEYPELREIRREIDDEIGDLAESALINGVRRGDPRSVMFYLDHKARDRGYGRQRVEVVGPNGGPVAVEMADPAAELIRRLDQIRQRRQRANSVTTLQ